MPTIKQRLCGKGCLPASCFGPGLATLGGPGPLQLHKRLPHALLSVGQVHVRQVHLKGLHTGQETARAGNEGEQADKENQRWGDV